MRRSNSGMSDGLVMLILGLMFMPAVGIAMCFSSDPEVSGIGKVLTVLGLAFYFLAWINSLC